MCTDEMKQAFLAELGKIEAEKSREENKWVAAMDAICLDMSKHDKVQNALNSIRKPPSPKKMSSIGAGQLQQTLEQHDKQHHPNGYKPGDTCKFRDALGVSNMTPQQAAQKAQGGGHGGQASGGTTGSGNGAKNLEKPIDLDTPAGPITVKTDVQKYVVEKLVEAYQDGRLDAERALQYLIDVTEAKGENTEEGESTAESEPSAEEGGENQNPETPTPKENHAPEETPAPESGEQKDDIPPDPSTQEGWESLSEEEQLLSRYNHIDSLYQMAEEAQRAGDTERVNKLWEEIEPRQEAYNRDLQKFREKAAATEPDGATDDLPLDPSKEDGFKTLSESEQLEKRKGYVEAVYKMSVEAHEAGDDEKSNRLYQKALDLANAWNEDMRNYRQRNSQAEAPQPQAESQAPKTEVEKKLEKEVSVEKAKAQAAREKLKHLEGWLQQSSNDNLYRLKDGKYRVGNTTYRDLSGKGVLGAIIGSIIAGLRGEQIITDWDRVSGKWDAIKASDARGAVRNGIASSGILSMVDAALADESLKGNPTAKAKLETVRTMFEQAKTPAAQMKALKEFEKWQNEHGKSNPKEVAKGYIEDGDENHRQGGVTASDHVKGRWEVSMEGVDDSESEGGVSNYAAVEDKIKNSLESNGFDIGDDAIAKEVNPSLTRVTISLGDKKPSRQAVASLMDELQYKFPHQGTPPTQFSYDKNNGKIVITMSNDKKGSVSFASLAKSDEFKKRIGDGSGAFFLGRGQKDGKPNILSLDEAVHILLAGTTGAGKSVRLDDIVCSLMLGNPPEDLQLIMVDPKKVEFTKYKNSPHVQSIVTDMGEAAGKFAWAVNEMENRYNLLSKVGAKDIKAYNKMAKEGKIPADLPQHLGRYAIVVDEFADLMETHGKDVEGYIKRLSGKARAAGIHLVIATQHPSVDVIPGVIKSNLPTKIGLTTARKADESVIGIQGLTNLPKKGPMMISKDGEPPSIIDGAYIDPESDNGVTRFLENVKATAGSPRLQSSSTSTALTAPSGETASSSAGSESSGRGKVSLSDASPDTELGSGLTVGQVNEAISQANSSGTPLQVPDDDGMEAHLRNSLQGWNIEKVEEDGISYLKATPSVASPTAPKSAAPAGTESGGTTTGGTESSGGGETTAETGTGGGAESGTGTTSGGTTSGSQPHDINTLEGRLAAIKDTYETRMAELTQSYNNKEISLEDFEDAEDELDDWRQKREAKARQRFKSAESAPSSVAEERNPAPAGTGGTEPAQTTQGGAQMNPQQESPFASLRTPEARKERAREIAERAKKEAHDAWKRNKDSATRDRDYQKAMADAEARYNQTIKDIDDGLSDEAIEARESAKVKAQADKDAALKATVVTEKKGKKIAGATKGASRGNRETLRPMKKDEISQANRAIKAVDPALELDVDDEFGVPARDGRGNVFARHPTNGSYGVVDKTGNFKYRVNTTHPAYKGEESKEARAALKRWLNPKKGDDVDALGKAYRNIAYGIDEALEEHFATDFAIAWAIAFDEDTEIVE